MPKQRHDIGRRKWEASEEERRQAEQRRLRSRRLARRRRLRAAREPDTTAIAAHRERVRRES